MAVCNLENTVDKVLQLIESLNGLNKDDIESKIISFIKDNADDIEIIKNELTDQNNWFLVGVNDNTISLLEKVLTEDNIDFLYKNLSSNYNFNIYFESHSKQDIIDSANEEVEDISNNYLQRFFGVDGWVQNIYKDFAKTNIFYRVIADLSDKKNPHFITTQKEVNEQLFNMQISLLENILNFMTNLHYKSVSELNGYINKLKNKKDFNNTVIKINKILDKVFDQSSFGKSFINSIEKQGRNVSADAEAFFSYVMFTNFDSTLRTILKDSIKIPTGFFNKFSDIKQYVLNPKSEMADGWRNEEMLLDDTNEIGGITKELISLLPRYKQVNGKWVKDENKMTFKQFVNAKTKISKILDDNKPSIHELYSNLSEEDRQKLFRVIPGNDNNYKRMLYNRFVNGKSLYDILSNINLSVTELAPIALYLLSKHDVFNKLDFEDQQGIISIFHGVFDYSNPFSFINLSLNTKNSDLFEEKNAIKSFNLDSKNDYFFYIAQMFSSIDKQNLSSFSFEQDAESGKEFVKRTLLSSKDINYRARQLSDILNGKNDANDGYFYKHENDTVDESDKLQKKYGINVDFEHFTPDDNNKRITLKLGEYTLTIFPDKYTISNSKNNRLSNEDLSDALMVFAPLFNDILPIDITNEQFLNQLGNISDIFEFASLVLYRKAVNEKVYQLGKTSIGVQKDASPYLNLANHTDVNLRKQSNQLELFPRKKYTLFRSIATANDIVNGIIGDQMVEDSSGNQISQVKLSQASCKHQFLWQDALSQQRNPTSHFLIYDAFVGVDFLKDFKDESGKVYKITECNPSEQFVSNFIYDFYGSAIQDGVIHVFGPIISDKPNIMRVGINLDAKIPYLENKTLRQILLEGNNDIFNNSITQIFQNELGRYFLKQYQFVQSQYNLLQSVFEQTDIEKIIRNELYLNENESLLLQELLIKPLKENIFTNGISSNFKEFNKYTDILKGNLDAVYNQLLVKENRNGIEQSLLDKLYVSHSLSGRAFKQSFIHGLITENPNIVFVDNLFGHFEGNNFRSNHLLVDNIIRYSEDESFIQSLDVDYKNKYWQKVMSSESYKSQIIQDYNDRIVSDLLKSNLYINVDKDNPIFTTNNANNSGINKLLFDRDWKRDNSSLRIIAKLNYNGETIEISTKRDFENSQLYRDIKGIIYYSLLGDNTEQAKRLMLLDGDYFDIRSIIDFVNSDSFINALNKLNLIRQINDKYYSLNQDQKNVLSSLLKQDLLNSLIGEFEEQYGENAREHAIRTILRGLNFNDAKNLFNKVKVDFEDIATINESSLSIDVNPAISRYNLISMLFNEEYTNSIVGTYLNHPFTKKGKESIREMEASAMGARVKRNVSFTATKHQYILNSLSGIPSELNIAVVQDLYNNVYNLIADGVEIDNEEFKTTMQILQDGATLVDSSMSILENNSLQNERVGVDKKQFGHMLNSDTGTGFILKTAGFVLTNARVRNSKLFRLLNYKMKSRKWLDGTSLFNGKNFIDFTRDFYGRKINFKDLNIYYAEPTSINDDGIVKLNHYRVFDVIIDNDGTVTVKRKLLQNNIKGHNNDEVYIDNSNDLVFQPGEINSNYDLWSKILGGEYSESYVRENGSDILSYSNDESSNQKLALLMNLVGGKEVINDNGIKDIQYFNPNEVVLSQLHCKQPLKASMISYIATEGAVKQGATNVNSNKLFTDPEYKMTTMKLLAKDLGVQLNAEHTVEQSTIAIMTQVMNSAAARGYSIAEGSEIYEILRQIALDAIQPELDGIKLGTEESRQYLKEAISDIIVKTLKYSQSTDSNILQAISNNIKAIDFNQTSKLQFVRDNIPIDNPAILRQIVSKVAVSLQKSTVKLRPPGNMNVLVPGDGFIKLFDGKTIEQYGSYELAQQFLQKKQTQRRKNPKNYILRNNPGQLLMGHTYEYVENGVNKKIKIAHPGIYWDLSEKLINGKISRVIEDITSGVDLSEANYFFRDINTGRLYNIWDLAVVRDRWELEKLISKAKNAEVSSELFETQEEYIKHLYSERDRLILALQEQLNILDPTSTQDEIEVFDHLDANGRVVSRKVRFNKEEVQQKAFDVIVPKSFADEFMLRVGDTLTDIKDNPNFFLKRLTEIYDTVKTNCYDIAFLGQKKNIYIAYSGFRSLPENFIEKKMLISYDKGHCYRLDEDSGNIIYELPADKYGNYKENIKLFVDEFGNEVLLTDDIDFFVENLDYVDVKLSNSFTLSKIDTSVQKYIKRQLDDQYKFLNQLKKCNNKTLQDFSKSILRGNTDINSMEELMADIIEQNTDPNYYYNITSELLKQFNKDLKEIKKGKTDIKSYTLKHLLKRAKVMHNSFLNSLEFIVSRTPAQCQQSFMSMRVVAFDNSGLNSIYVSRFQLYFQGSDFDIDKANILTHAIKNGCYQVWSPLYDLSRGEDVRLASRLLPFPTGIEINEKNNPFNENSESFYDLVDKFNLHSIIEENGKILPENYAKYITRISKLIKYINRHKNIGLNLNINEDVSQFRYKKVLDDINMHNLYFVNHPKKNKIDAIYNRISTLIFDISANPVNWIQGWASVDVVTGPFKDGANKSPQARESKTFTGRSVLSLAKQQSLTIEGKSNVGIAANSLKVYEAIAHAMYETLAFGSEEEIKNMLFNIKIAGKEIHIFANAWVNNSRFKQLPEDIQEVLANVDNITDAYTSLSALLSLAADNAKDPTLSKINAGPKMIGLYTAGIVLGIQPDLLINIVNSPTGLLINSLMHGNVFYGQKGKYDLLSVLNYIEKSPLNDLPNMPEEVLTFIRSVADVGLNSELAEWQIQQLFGNQDYSTEHGRQLLSLLSKYKRKLENALNGIDEEIPEVEVSNVVAIARHKLDQIKNLGDYKRYKRLQKTQPESDEFKELSSSEEIKDLLEREQALRNFIANPNSRVPYEVEDSQRDIQRANEKISDSINSLIQQIETLSRNKEPEEDEKKNLKATKQKARNIVDYINRLLNAEYKYLDMIDIINSDWIDNSKNIQNIKELIYVNSELRVMSHFTSLNQGYPHAIDEQIQWVSDFERLIGDRINLLPKSRKEELENDIKAFQELTNDKYQVDARKFAVDEDYRNAVINFYDKIKKCCNPYRTIVKTQHYLGYFQGMVVLIDGLDSMSVIYNQLKKLSPQLLSKFNANGQEGIQLEKRLQNFLNFVSHRLFFQNIIRDFKFKMDEDDSYISLLSAEGRMKFKEYMDETVFPYLISNLKNNEFIKSLIKVEYTGNYDHNITLNYRSSITSMPRSEYEKQIFRQVKKGLYKLQQINLKGTNIPISQLIFLYNLIAYEGKADPRSFTSFFEEIIAENKDTLIRSYNAFWSEFLPNHGLNEDVDYTSDELYSYVAPIISQSEALDSPKKPYAYVIDNKTKRCYLLKNIKPSQETLEQLEEEERENDIEEGFPSFVERIRQRVFNSGGKKRVYMINTSSSLKNSDTGLRDWKNVGIDINNLVYYTSDLRVSVSNNEASIQTLKNGRFSKIKIHESHKISKKQENNFIKNMIEQCIKTIQSEDGNTKNILDLIELRKKIDYFSNQKEYCKI